MSICSENNKINVPTSMLCNITSEISGLFCIHTMRKPRDCNSPSVTAEEHSQSPIHPPPGQLTPGPHASNYHLSTTCFGGNGCLAWFWSDPWSQNHSPLCFCYFPFGCFNQPYPMGCPLTVCMSFLFFYLKETPKRKGVKEPHTYVWQCLLS